VEVKDRARRSRSRSQVGSLLLVLTLATLAVAVLGAATSSATPTRSLACGGIPNTPPNDPNGVLAKLKLSKSLQHDYTGWTQPLMASTWAKWKPKSKPPYKVAIVWSAPSNSWNSYVIKLIPKFLRRSPLVDKNINVTFASSQQAVSEQVQQYNAAVQGGADIILTNALSPTALQPAIEAAAKQGIPTVSEINTINTPDAVSISPNTYLDATSAADAMVKALGGKGNVLEVLGVPGTSTVLDEQKAWRTIFNSCPDINLVGEIPAFYSVALAKTGVLQWLSTHSQNVDGVINTATMSQGILAAFQQAGRPVPFIADIAAQKGFMAYWAENQSKGYKSVATVGGATSAADITTKVILRMLAGQGPKINQLIWRHPVVTAAMVKSYLNKSWTPDTIGTVENPKPTWWSDKDLDRFFAHPNIRKGTRY
jgi:ribose transport system substrate-binding protein